MHISIFTESFDNYASIFRLLVLFTTKLSYTLNSQVNVTQFSVAVKTKVCSKLN